MYGSVTIAIVLQGQLDYCSRAKDKMHGVFCLRHYPRNTGGFKFLAEVVNFHVLLRVAVVP